MCPIVNVLDFNNVLLSLLSLSFIFSQLLGAHSGIYPWSRGRPPGDPSTGLQPEPPVQTTAHEAQPSLSPCGSCALLPLLSGLGVTAPPWHGILRPHFSLSSSAPGPRDLIPKPVALHRGSLHRTEALATPTMKPRHQSWAPRPAHPQP